MKSAAPLLRLYCCFGVFSFQLNAVRRFGDAFSGDPISGVTRRRQRLVTKSPAPRYTLGYTASTHFASTEEDQSEESSNEISTEADDFQRELNTMASNNQETFGFNPDNFDKSALPVPLFTGLVIMAFSLYMTGYFLYVGINGFPENDTFPRPF
jgi:hypothetical protein